MVPQEQKKLEPDAFLAVSLLEKHNTEFFELQDHYGAPRVRLIKKVGK